MLRSAAALHPATARLSPPTLSPRRLRHHDRRGAGAVLQTLPARSGDESVLLFLRGSTNALGSADVEESPLARLDSDLGR